MGSSSNQTDFENEINLKELFGILWQGKISILLVTSVFIFFGIWYLQVAERKHLITSTYKTMDEKGAGINLGGLGGLASFAGVGLPQSSNSDFETFKYLINSEEVAEKIYQNRELVKTLFQSEFDQESNLFKMPELTLIGALKQRMKSIITGRNYTYTAPNPARLAIIVNRAFSMRVDKATGFLVLSAETSRPTVVMDLMEAAVKATDNLLKTRYVESSAQSLNFYQQKISRAKSREHREALARLIVSEEKKLMLASTGKSFVVEPITRPQISLYPSSPKANKVLLLSMVLGIFVGLGLVFVLHSSNKPNYNF